VISKEIWAAMPSRQMEKKQLKFRWISCVLIIKIGGKGRILDVDFSGNFSALITVILSRIVLNKKPFITALGDFVSSRAIKSKVGIIELAASGWLRNSHREKHYDDDNIIKALITGFNHKSIASCWKFDIKIY
jgi:hypothetical protein